MARAKTQSRKGKSATMHHDKQKLGPKGNPCEGF
jgi:hypothetical protein